MLTTTFGRRSRATLGYTRGFIRRMMTVDLSMNGAKKGLLTESGPSGTKAKRLMGIEFMSED